MAEKLTEMECFKTQTEHDASLNLKIYLLQVNIQEMHKRPIRSFVIVGHECKDYFCKLSEEIMIFPLTAIIWIWISIGMS